MTDVVRDISLLVQIARVDAGLNNHRVQLEQIPAQIAAAEKKIAALNEAEAKAVGEMEAMKKERRDLERSLEDDEQKVTKFKNDLMHCESNAAYTAALKEIAAKESEIERKEERLLELMDAIEEKEGVHGGIIEDIASRRAAVEGEKAALESRTASLKQDMERLAAEKPRLLSEVDDSIRRRYQRLLDKYGDVAVVSVEGDTCGGCHTQLPPQVIVEVKKNNQLITCQSCGRLLIHYAD